MPLDPSLLPVVEDASRQNNVDPTLLRALIETESSGNTRAVSPAGAIGLTQLMPDTARGLGVADPGDPVQSIYGGAKYLAQGLEKYGDPVRALMFYHGGPDESQWGPRTRAYPLSVAQHYAQFAQPSSGAPQRQAAAAQPAGTSPDFDLAEGDSIGVGFAKFGGLAGNPVGGRNPQAVLDNIAGNLSNDPNYYRGKTVLLSSGTMNDPNGALTGLVPQQIKAIQAAGGNVVLAGADTGRFAPRNDQLAAIAQQAGVPFAGPLPTDNVHPGPQGYLAYKDRAAGLIARRNGAGMNGIDALANAGQPDPYLSAYPNDPRMATSSVAQRAMQQSPMQLAQAAGPADLPDITKMSDDDIVNGILSGKLPLPPGMSRAAVPASQPAPSPQNSAAPQMPNAGPPSYVPAPVTPPAQPQMPQGPVADPRAIAEFGVYSGLAGRAGAAQPMEQYYYNSPQYLQQKALADKLGSNQQEIGPNGIQNMPGAVSSKAEEAGAIKGAQEAQTYQITRDGAIYKGGVYVGHAPKEVQIVDPQGNKFTAFTPPMGAVAPNMAAPPTAMPPGAAAPTGMPSGSPQTASPMGAAPPLGAVMNSPSELGPGQHAALTTRAEEEQKQRQLVIKEANDAMNSRATIQNMANEAGNFYQGAGAETWQQAARLLRVINPSFNGQVSSYEDFVKNAGNLTRQAVRETTARAAVQEFNMIQNTLPSPEMSPQGMQRVTNELLGLNDFKIAKAQAQQQWESTHGGPGNVTDFETTFQRQASPYAFIVARMDPQYRQELFSKLQGSDEGRHELQRLGEQLSFIKHAGISPYQ